VSEFWFYYLKRSWREQNAPHSEYNEDVNFECSWGYSTHPSLKDRERDDVNFAVRNYKDAIADLVATLVKK
jgi:hypothetical protein